MIQKIGRLIALAAFGSITMNASAQSNGGKDEKVDLTQEIHGTVRGKYE